MSTIKAAAGENLRSGDLVQLDLATLEARRYAGAAEPGALGVANRDIEAGAKLVWDLATGRLTLDGEDVLERAGKALYNHTASDKPIGRLSQEAIDDFIRGGLSIKVAPVDSREAATLTINQIGVLDMLVAHRHGPQRRSGADHGGRHDGQPHDCQPRRGRRTHIGLPLREGRSE